MPNGAILERLVEPFEFTIDQDLEQEHGDALCTYNGEDEVHSAADME
jgi:hypothetical protein